MSIYTDYLDGALTAEQALAKIVPRIKLCDTMIADLETERQTYRSQAESIAREQDGPVHAAGYVVTIRPASRLDSFDRKAVGLLLHELADVYPDIAARVEACRVYRTVAGGLVLTRERSA